MNIFCAMKDIFAPAFTKVKEIKEADENAEGFFFMDNSDVDYEVTIDETTMPIMHIVTCTKEKVTIARYIRDEKKTVRNPISNLTLLFKNGEIVATLEEVQENLLALFAFRVHELRKILRERGILQQLQEIGNKSSGVLITAASEEDINARIVCGKDRPDLPCLMFGGLFANDIKDAVMMRPYVDELITDDMGENMSLEEKIVAAEDGNTDLKNQFASDFIITDGVLTSYVGDDENIVIPDSVTEIGDNAFYGLESSITYVTIPEGVTRIGNRAFFGCMALTGVTIPKSLKEIGDLAFFGCESLSISIPDHVEQIGIGAFGGCDEMADEKGFVIIRGALHFYCGEDTDVHIPEGVIQIEEEAFHLSEDIEGVTLPEGLISIQDNAFLNCYDLKYAIIPGTVSDIAPHAFDDCEELTIFAPGGSYAIDYAKRNKISFEAQGEMKSTEDSQIPQIIFEDKIFVHTGLSLDEEKRVDEIIISKGGILKSSTVLKTNYLIVNEYYGHQTKKYLRAMELIERGTDIKIIPVAAFLEHFDN